MRYATVEPSAKILHESIKSKHTQLKSAYKEISEVDFYASTSYGLLLTHQNLCSSQTTIIHTLIHKVPFGGQSSLWRSICTQVNKRTYKESQTRRLTNCIYMYVFGKLKWI